MAERRRVLLQATIGVRVRLEGDHARAGIRAPEDELADPGADIHHHIAFARDIARVAHIGIRALAEARAEPRPVARGERDVRNAYLSGSVVDEDDVGLAAKRDRAAAAVAKSLPGKREPVIFEENPARQAG